MCILIVCLCVATLTESFPCFFLSCKANARVKPAKTGHGPHSSKFLCCSIHFLCCSMYFCVVLRIVGFVSFSVLFVCVCVLYDCHRVATQLQLNISYHMCVCVCFSHLLSSIYRFKVFLKYRLMSKFFIFFSETHWRVAPESPVSVCCF